MLTNSAKSKAVQKVNFLNQRKNIGSLCCAPFTTMYLGHGGLITACCANRTKILGKYPEKLLIDIWNGKEYTEMRKDLSNFTFSKGCDQCKMMLNSNNFTTLKIPFYDIKGEYKQLKYPNRLNLELDNKCNLECIMCTGQFSSKILKNREKKPSYISPYNTDSFFEEFKPFIDNAGQIEFYGGEPFLIEVYLKILNYLKYKKSHIPIYIQSNGTVLTEGIIEYLNNLNINLSLSIDSPFEETYEKIRVGSNFKKLITNVSKFSNIQTQNKRNFSMSAVLCKLNLEELIGFYKFANEYNMLLYFHDLTFPRELSVYTCYREDLTTSILKIEQQLEDIRPVFNIEKNNYNAILNQLTHLRYIRDNIVKYKSQYNFSFECFLKQNYPDLKGIYIDNLKKYSLSNEQISVSIVNQSNLDDLKSPELFLKREIDSTAKDNIAEAFESFIKNEKDKLDYNKYLQQIV